ncbi:MAG: CidA/LrgA family protein [Alphaproteobacteria bacterium]|nr:CidA/LrgA family protein [Alphaproteobacteria bacterium]
MSLGFITVLLVFQLLGEAVSRGFGLPLPGPVVGMALLFLGLMVRGGLPDGLRDTAGGILKHLALLFVPAGVGVVMHVHLLEREWPAIATALVASTAATILATGLAMAALDRAGKRGGAGDV